MDDAEATAQKDETLAALGNAVVGSVQYVTFELIPEGPKASLELSHPVCRRKTGNVLQHDRLRVKHFCETREL
jgi:hypothetical protein